MKLNRLGGLAFGLAICMTTGAVQAAIPSLTLSAVNSPVTAGSQAIFKLWMDFTGDPTLGGGVDVVFGGFTNGNQLSFVSYTPEALGDPFYINVPAVNAAGDRLEGITFGDPINGVGGSALVGTLVFGTQVAGNYSLSLMDSALAGGFHALSGAPQFPDYIPAATLAVDAAPVPVPTPAAGWLMLSGLGWLLRKPLKVKRKA